MDLGLQGQRVLVTGGAGGIGSATVRAFAAEGAQVAIAYHGNREGAEALARDVDGVAVQADLRDEVAVEALFDSAVGRLGALDAVVANAGVWPSQEVPVRALGLERWRATLDSNLTATFLTARGFLRHLARRRAEAGSLVLVASTAGEFGEAGHADYAAAKAGIAYGLARSLKNEIVQTAPRGRVNVVAPGWTVTPMAADRLDEATLAQVTATMPLRKVAAPEDVAAAIVWLSSSTAAGHVTGEIVTVAGGMEGRLLHPLR